MEATARTVRPGERAHAAAIGLVVRVRTGTSGFSYPAWKGSFYPEKLPAARMLGHYARKLSAVEINNTFYRMPTDKLLAGWASQVPDDFSFALKAPRRISHDLRLHDAADVVRAFSERAFQLGARLGPTLIQLPPFLKKDLGRLLEFLAVLPPGFRATFEFRHESWFADDVYDALSAGNAALCVADSEKLQTPFVPTTRWGYLRLRREGYEDTDLGDWAARISKQDWEDVWVFFKHEDEGVAPALATRLSALFQ